ncbi:type ISP restriction/modification enzyme, partial [Bartonella queenslandensis]|uniref:type ISP restriction/modification enzyme n=1 Tax=Bartonella queenslandensis TaxID=481138 RepID=UPI000585C10A
FENFSCGIVTSRDAWAYNSSLEALGKNMSNMIGFYNSEVKRFNETYEHVDRRIRKQAVNNFVNADANKISWSRAIKQELCKEKLFTFENNCLTQSLYRPFTKQWLYYNRTFNEMVYQMPCIFPMGEAIENKVIQVSGVGSVSGFSVLMTNTVPNYHAIDT